MANVADIYLSDIKQQFGWFPDYNTGVSVLPRLDNGNFYIPVEGIEIPNNGFLWLYSYYANGHGSIGIKINGHPCCIIGTGETAGSILIPVNKGDILTSVNYGARWSWDETDECYFRHSFFFKAKNYKYEPPITNQGEDAVIDSGQVGTSYYRKWESGYIEQWGIADIGGATTNNLTIEFPVEFGSSDSYMVTVAQDSTYSGLIIHNYTKSSMDVNSGGSGAFVAGHKIRWSAKGY